MPDPIDVRDLMREIQARIRQRSQRGGRGPVSALMLQVEELEEGYRLLLPQLEKVGSVPPGPPTWRGRFGAKLVGVAQRLFFWYTMHAREFHTALVLGLKEQIAVVRALAQALEEEQQKNRDLAATVDALTGRLQALEERLSHMDRTQNDTRAVSGR